MDFGEILLPVASSYLESQSPQGVDDGVFEL
jgi:hypothetical protein